MRDYFPKGTDLSTLRRSTSGEDSSSTTAAPAELHWGAVSQLATRTIKGQPNQSTSILMLNMSCGGMSVSQGRRITAVNK
jgi:hypothetical protein